MCNKNGGVVYIGMLAEIIETTDIDEKFRQQNIQHQ